MILDGIASIFIPDTEYIETTFNAFLEEMQLKFGFDASAFKSLFQGEHAVEDVYTDYSIPGVGAFRLKLLDASFLVDGVTFFRPFIRGFLVLLMLLYHIKQVISFFGYDSGVVTGRSDYIADSKKAQRG